MNDRNFRQFDVEMIEQLLRGLVHIKIHISVGICIPAEEFAETKRVGRVARAHQDDVAVAIVYQCESAKDECPDENLAQFGISCDKRS